MRVLCAWCGQVLKDGRGPTSHGICSVCCSRLEQSVSMRWRKARNDKLVAAFPRP